jgi:putative transcriptional regulator
MGRARKTELENVVNAEIGARVVACREERGWTQSHLANELDVSAAHMNALEAGRYTWSAATIQRLTRVFGVSASTLLGADPPENDLMREWRSLYQLLSERDRLMLADLANKLANWSQTFTMRTRRKRQRATGCLVSLEGIHGALIHDVGESLARALHAVHAPYEEKNPIYTFLMDRCANFDRRITQQIHERTMLFAVERVQRQESVIRPALERNEIVLTPYHFLAPAVYQEMEGLNDRRIIDILEGLLAPPDIIVLLHFKPEIAIRKAVQQRPKKGEFYFPYGQKEIEKARDLYKEKASKEAKAWGYEVIEEDVDTDVVTPELIEKLAHAIRRRAPIEPDEP